VSDRPGLARMADRRYWRSYGATAIPDAPVRHGSGGNRPAGEVEQSQQGQ